MPAGLLKMTAAAALCKTGQAGNAGLLLIAAFCLMLAMAKPVATTAAEPVVKQVTVFSSQNAVVVSSHGEKLLEYRGAPNPNKPYLQSWKSPAGVELLLDNAGEHAHHHGLMFAVGVDDTNFWHEDGRKSVIGAPVQPRGDGHQLPRESVPSVSTGDRTFKAKIDQVLDWTDAAGSLLLTEHRRIDVYDSSSESPISMLAWQTKLQPAEGRKSVALWGAHYYGLGMRLAKQFDERGEFRSSDQAPPRPVRDDEQLRSGKWCAYSIDDAHHPLTVLMFDHPENFKPAAWFTMAKPFAYLSATLPLNQDPHTLRAGETMTLRYGLVAADRTLATDEINELYATWLKSYPHD